MAEEKKITIAMFVLDQTTGMISWQGHPGLGLNELISCKSMFEAEINARLIDLASGVVDKLEHTEQLCIANAKAMSILLKDRKASKIISDSLEEVSKLVEEQ